MNLTSPKIIKELLLKYGAQPNKIMGQNFLINKNVLSKIIKTANLSKNDTILEVGPGIGTLTQELAKNAGKIIAIEKDRTMIKILQETLADYKNIEILQGDILKIKKLKISNYKLIANIPYYLTSPLIRKFLEAENKPEFMVLMVQKEVAQRICAKPPNMSLLAVSVQFYCSPLHSNPSEGAGPKIISYVSKNCFWPAPKVDSAIIKITPHAVTRAPTSREAGGRGSPDLNSQLFFKIVKAGFSHPRKQLAGNLLALSKDEGSKELAKKKVADWLKKSGINPTQRAETLSVQDWIRLVDNSWLS